MVMKKAQIASIHLLSIVNKLQVANLHGIKRESLFSLRSVFAVDVIGQN